MLTLLNIYNLIKFKRKCKLTQSQSRVVRITSRFTSFLISYMPGKRQKLFRNGDGSDFFLTLYNYTVGISECKTGYFGDFCNEPCPPGSFGFKCGGNCLPRCTKEECHHVSGCPNYIRNKTKMIVTGTMK